MTDEGKRPLEGWTVSAPRPLLAMLLVPLTFAALLLLGGTIYRHTLRQEAQPPTPHFPYPQLELTQTPPNINRQDFRTPPPPNIDRAMAETARQGSGVWSKGTR